MLVTLKISRKHLDVILETIRNSPGGRLIITADTVWSDFEAPVELVSYQSELGDIEYWREK